MAVAAYLESFTQYAVAIWLIVAAVCLFVEVITVSGWLLWPAAAAGVTAVIARIWVPDPLVQLFIFVGLTIVDTYIGRKLIDDGPRRQRSKLNRDSTETVGRLIGLTGTVSGAFREGMGRVHVDGKDWPAELDGQADLRKGAKVYVVALKGGTRLKVKVRVSMYQKKKR